jgi:hypothetical protein
MARDDKEDDNADFDHISGMAKRLNLKGKDRDKYIHDHMRGLGYTMVPSYVRPDDDDEGSRFSFGRSGGNRRRRSRDDDDDDDGYPF